MDFGKEERKAVAEAIEDWADRGLLTSQKAAELKMDLAKAPPERQQIAHYFFIIAIACALLAFSALFLDEKLLERFRIFYAISDFWLGIGLLLLSVLCFWWLAKRRVTVQGTVQEAGLLPGALAAIGGVVYLLRAADLSASPELLLGITAAILGSMSIYFRSVLLWAGAMLSLCGCYGVFSEQYALNGLFLGLNYPFRFLFFGFLSAFLAMLLRRNAGTQYAQKITWHFAFITFFTALWGISIFGNYQDWAAWQAVRQTQVLIYGVLFAMFAGAALWFGIRKQIPIARDYGLLFLLLNLYTRYFEFFWETTNKGLFFLMIAISFFGFGWLLMRGGFLRKAKGE